MSNTSFIDKAIDAMKAPSQMGIICVDVTNKCDLSCSNCTRLLENQEGYWDMSLANWRLALRSLSDYPGTIAMIGGNPCMHPKFEELCKIFVEEIPQKQRRGLWTNNAFKFAELAKTTFGVFNLNPHNVERGIKSLATLKNLGWYYEGNSEHSPLLVAIKDLYAPEEMWEKISKCDINHNWSASIVQNVAGELRAYFCEVAASFDIARKGDMGIPVVPGWWKSKLSSFRHQVEHFCPGCGVAARLKGTLDREEEDCYSETNRDLAEKSSALKKRKIIRIDSSIKNPATKELPVTVYSTKLAQKNEICVITPYFKESIEVLRRCHESVISQHVDAKVTHVMVADGFPVKEIDSWPVSHIVLPRANANNGNTPRGIGAVLAEQLGANFIAYLDADNWYHSGHLSSLLDLFNRTKADVCCSWRTFHDIQGEEIDVTEEMEDKLVHVDTSAYLVHKKAFKSNYYWFQMPNKLSPMCDRVFFNALKSRKYSIAYSKSRTVAFTSTYASHYLESGKQPPANAKYDTLGESVAFLHTIDGVKSTSSALGIWPVANFIRSVIESIPKSNSTTVVSQHAGADVATIS